MPAVIFDLDETLLDTHKLREVRKLGRWGQLAKRLAEAQPYKHAESRVQAAQLPARVKRMGFDVGVLTHSPRLRPKEATFHEAAAKIASHAETRTKRRLRPGTASAS